MFIFYFFAALSLWSGYASLKSGRRYLDYFRRELDARRPAFTPFASIIVPCRGMDQGLRENVSALFTQDYPNYELVFVSDRADDAALVVVEGVMHEHATTGPRARVVVAGRTRTCGQKVHNLRAAVREVDARSEVLVFVDTDARPRSGWLRALVAPLADERVGAATGYRWFVPVRGGFASQLRAVWNASVASALGENRSRNFCWGGSTAIRRATFHRLNMLDQWRGTLSDDYALTRALQTAKLPIHFVPGCLTASYEDCTLAELSEFTTRQIKITRVYAPHLWKMVLFGNLLFTLVFFGGMMLVAARAALGLSFVVPLALVAAMYVLGTWKARLRLRAVSLVLRAEERRSSAMAHMLLWPLASALYAYNALAAAFSRRITWRGITYELKSPTETVTIMDGPAEASEVGEARNV